MGEDVIGASHEAGLIATVPQLSSIRRVKISSDALADLPWDLEIGPDLRYQVQREVG